MSANIRVNIGGTVVPLSTINFVGSGGEGDVYAKDGVAYKIYHDPAKMIASAKINELARITDDRVITPKTMIHDKSGTKVLGYTMRFLPHPVVLVQMFSNRFRTEKGVSHDRVLALAQQHRDLTAAVHEAACLVIDGNENNVLVSETFDELFLIDADSFQTPSYPATAINDTIRDRETPVNKFTCGSDWFSHAVLMAWLLRGIHPFRGALDGFPSGDLDARMKARKTIWSDGVRVPRAALPETAIPPGYLDWMLSVFHAGVRCAPPTKIDALPVPIGSIAQPKRVIVSTTLDIQKRHDFADDVITVLPLFSDLVVLTEGRVHIGAVADWPGFTSASPWKNVVLEEPTGRDLYHFDGTAFIGVRSGDRVVPPTRIDDAVVYQNRAYTRSGDMMAEMRIESLGRKILCSARSLGPVMPNATQLFPGVVLQNMLGHWFAKVFPTVGTSKDYKLADIDGSRVISARYERGVLIVIVYRGGQYDRIIYTLGSSTQPTPRVAFDVTTLEPNFAVLENGVCLHLEADGSLEMFRISDPTKVELINDPAITADGDLVAYGNQAYYVNGSTLWSIRKR